MLTNHPMIHLFSSLALQLSFGVHRRTSASPSVLLKRLWDAHAQHLHNSPQGRKSDPDGSKSGLQAYFHTLSKIEAQILPFEGIAIQKKAESGTAMETRRWSTAEDWRQVCRIQYPIALKSWQMRNTMGVCVTRLDEI